ncbi:enoyl-CoA hydratase-related protein [Acuticoccus sp.]|uniref:enoyl-CoA hydratase-related protein n=1 Tax=Acuticoccus sp. TaxID=1904378 RepID=UPI003B5182B2
MDAPARHTNSSEAPHVLVRDEGEVRRIVMNRGLQRNLLTFEMMAALKAALDAPDARVIIVAADGPAFCVGHDMKAMSSHHGDPDGGSAYFTDLFAACSDLMLAIATARQPVIAEVHAVAVAAGCQLVAACDLAVASEAATFGTTGVTYGLYCSTPAVPLTRTVPAKHAAEMLMTGDVVDAEHAARIGLVNRVVPAERLVEEAAALADRLAGKSAAVLALGKHAVQEQAGLPLAEAYARASRAMVANLALADGREGLAAFGQKRPGRWTDA